MTAQPPTPGPQPPAHGPAPHPGSSPQRPATAPGRHRPLTDDPCGVIPTPRGQQLLTDYQTHRTQQHPKETNDA